MARGYIFHVTRQPEGMGTMSQWDFEEDIDGLGVDFVKDASPEAASVAVKGNLVNRLARMGFTVTTYRGPDDSEGYAVNPLDPEGTKKAKAAYFQHKLDELKKIVGGMDAAAMSERDVAQSLQRCIDDRYGDMICFDDTYGRISYTMDQFMRRIEPGTWYYISGNAVLMH